MCDQCLSKTLSPSLLRRRLLTGSLAAVFAAHSGFVGAQTSTLTTTAQALPDPDAAFARIMAGNARYASNQSRPRDHAFDRERRAQAQHPYASILGCSDSRVEPAHVFDEGQGDLFVIRVAGNIARADALASLEYGVSVLGTPLVMVLGHSRCGAVQAAIDSPPGAANLPGHLPGLVAAIQPAVAQARAKTPDNLLDASIAANAQGVAQSLRTASPIIDERVRAGKVRIVAAVYNIGTGRVTVV